MQITEIQDAPPDMPTGWAVWLQTNLKKIFNDLRQLLIGLYSNEDGDVVVTGAISSATTTITTGTYDTLDVGGVNTVFVDTSGGNVTLRGTVGGVNGQILNIIVHDWTGNTQINNADANGTQKFYLHRAANEVLVTEPGGWIFVNMAGDHWHDCSHAKHV